VEIQEAMFFHHSHSKVNSIQLWLGWKNGSAPLDDEERAEEQQQKKKAPSRSNPTSTPSPTD